MKSIRIASGVRHIEDSDERLTLFRVQEVLTEHRSALITGILNDLPRYLEFKVPGKVNKEIQAEIRSKLLDLSNSKVSIDRFAGTVHEIEKNDRYRVPSQGFYKEIDSMLDSVLNPTQLMLVK